MGCGGVVGEICSSDIVCVSVSVCVCVWGGETIFCLDAKNVLLSIENEGTIWLSDSFSNLDGRGVFHSKEVYLFAK